MTTQQIDDLSAYLIAGRVKARPSGRSETDERSPRQGIRDGVEAESIGFRRVFISERWNLKETSVLLGAVGALTSRVGLGTGLINPSSRHPLHTAAVGSTLTAAFGNRVVLGLGRGDDNMFKGTGLSAYGFAGLADYVRIVKRLWAGETVSYHGPVGNFDSLALGDLHEGPSPEIWYGMFGLPSGVQTAAACMDGVLLVPNMTPDATRAAVTRLRRECERIGRDPESLRIAQCVVTAPELDDQETRQVAHARAFTYLQAPGYGEALCRVNGWDSSIVAALSRHPQLGGIDRIADNVFHRSELVAAASLIPEQWITESCAIGSVDECLAQFRRYRDAGADELVTYGSTPGQNAGLARAWAGTSDARITRDPVEPGPSGRHRR
jgi:5,10-methylenetetrahydromethanopterin reductase